MKARGGVRGPLLFFDGVGLGARVMKSKPALCFLGLLGLALLLSLAGRSRAGDNPFCPDLPFETAIITYELEGLVGGRVVSYFEGRRAAHHTRQTIRLKDRTHQLKTIEIQTPAQVTYIDLTNRTAFSLTNIRTLMAQEFEKLKPADQKIVRANVARLGAATAFNLTGQPLKTEQGVFLGRPVEIVRTGQATVYTWAGTMIDLASETSLPGGELKKTAVSIETDVPIPPAVFETPQGIKVEVMEGRNTIMPQLAEAWLEALLKLRLDEPPGP